MPVNGSGVYNLPPGYTAVSGQTILPSQHNPPLEDVAAALSLTSYRDGRAAATGNWPMGGNRITGLGNAVDSGDAVSKAQISSISGFRNVLINPFSINQRGVSGTVVLAAGAYGHDRWKAGSSGCTYTFSTTSGVTTLNISAGSLQQVVEASSFLGRNGTYVLSWNGTSLGRINGGTTGGSGAVTANLSAAANATVEFLGGTVSLPQLEKDYVTDFSTRHIQQELALCQRYYEGSDGTIAWTQPGSAASVFQRYSYPFKVKKRATPTTQILTSLGSSALVAAGTTFFIVGSSGTAMQENNFTFTADAEL